MATPTYRDILRVGEVLENDLDTDPGGGDPGVIQSAIQDVTGWIAVQIGVDSGTPIIHRTKQGVTRREWLRDDVQEDTTYRAWANERPVVQVVSPSDVSVRYDNKQLLRDDREASIVEYFAGWKRRDTSASDLPTGTGEDLDGLTETVPTLPDDIRRIALILVLYEIGRIEYGTAVQQTTQTIGNQGEATMTKDTDALRRYARDYLNEYTVPQL